MSKLKMGIDITINRKVIEMNIVEISDSDVEAAIELLKESEGEDYLESISDMASMLYPLEFRRGIVAVLHADMLDEPGMRESLEHYIYYRPSRTMRESIADFIMDRAEVWKGSVESLQSRKPSWNTP